MRYLRQYVLFSGVIVWLLSLSSPVYSSPFVPPASDDHRFAFDILAFRANEDAAGDSARVDIYVAVPYRAISFLYAGDKYVADYGTVIQIFDSTSEHMLLDRYQTYSIVESVMDHEKREEVGQDRADAQQFSIRLLAGHRYDMRIIVRDLSSKHEIDTSFIRSIPRFVGSPSALSDIMVYRARRGNSVLPSIGSDVGPLAGESSGIFSELYYHGADTTLLMVSQVYAVRNGEVQDREVLQRAVNFVRATQPTTALFQEMSFDDLWMGRYQLRTYVLPVSADTARSDEDYLRSHALARTTRDVDVSVQRGIPIVEADLDEAIEQLRLIAYGDDLSALEDARTLKEKRQAIITFWAHRDPERKQRGNRPMQVFYARVQYANEHFGSGFQQGWKTDRGRVLIALGYPEFVDKHPYEAMKKPYEVWEYPRHNVRYVFVDQYLLGDYRLVGAPPAPGTFLWDR